MDPLTHTLVGANLAATRLGRSTPLAAAALLIGVNAPDVDVLAYLQGSDFAFGFRRGWTHGLGALLVLPALLTGALLLWERVRGETAHRADPRKLFGLCFLAGLTHPALDWLNNYGMRWLMPFDGTWFYGDAVFIMDPWLWLILGGGWLLGRPPTRALLLGWGALSATITAVAYGRAPAYVPAVVTVAGVLLAALLWRPNPDRAARLGTAALALAALFIGGMLTIHHLAEYRVVNALAARGLTPSRLLVGPMPINPLVWDVVVDLGTHYRTGRFAWPESRLQLTDRRLPVPAADDPTWRAARSDPAVQGFMTWSRFPWVLREETPAGTRVMIMDARYVKGGTGGFGSTSVLVER